MVTGPRMLLRPTFCFKDSSVFWTVQESSYFKYTAYNVDRFYSEYSKGLDEWIIQSKLLCVGLFYVQTPDLCYTKREELIWKSLPVGPDLLSQSLKHCRQLLIFLSVTELFLHIQSKLPCLGHSTQSLQLKISTFGSLICWQDELLCSQCFCGLAIYRTTTESPQVFVTFRNSPGQRKIIKESFCAFSVNTKQL